VPITGALAWPPAVTMRYVPTASGTNDGFAAVASESAAALVAGFSTSVHANESASPSASTLAEPSNTTVSPAFTAVYAVAAATGGRCAAVITSSSGALCIVPSLTRRRSTYWPAPSQVNAGFAALVLERFEVAPAGCDWIVHAYVSESPSGSVLVEPSSASVPRMPTA
jgi:hypothetical protein